MAPFSNNLVNNPYSWCDNDAALVIDAGVGSSSSYQQEEGGQAKTRRIRRCYSDSSTIPRKSSMLKKSCQPKRASIQNTGVESDVYQPTTTRIGNPFPSRRVTFKSTVLVKRIPSMASLSNNPRDLWFQEDEYDMMTKRAAKLISALTSSSSVSTKNKKYCIRGLEKCIDPKSASKNRYNAWDAVFQEQDLQRRRGRHQR